MDNFIELIGARLKEERRRLGLNQDQFAEVGGVKKPSQIAYEQGKRAPDAAYLLAVSKIGVDLQFVLLGELSENALGKDEIELLMGYRNLDIRGKAGVLGTISGMISAEAKTSIAISGNSNQVVQGNQTVKAPLKLNISTTKKKAVK